MSWRRLRNKNIFLLENGNKYLNHCPYLMAAGIHALSSCLERGNIFLFLYFFYKIELISIKFLRYFYEISTFPTSSESQQLRLDYQQLKCTAESFLPI